MLVMKLNNNGTKVIKYEEIYHVLFAVIEYFVYQVMVSVAGGSYAEYVAVHMGCVMKIPKGISMVEAAG
jgi:NADPH:quinone reductase-like Zn-dependent oxidoreductase